MAKWQNDDMLDAALNYVKTNSAKVTLCTSQPSTYSDATTTYGTGSGVALAQEAVVTGDYAALADGSVSGRTLAVPACTDVTIDATGTATHVAIVSGSEILYVTTCVSQAVTAANLVTIPTWDIEIRDAV